MFQFDWLVYREPDRNEYVSKIVISYLQVKIYLLPLVECLLDFECEWHGNRVSVT
jgi:hypothetical protein